MMSIDITGYERYRREKAKNEAEKVEEIIEKVEDATEKPVEEAPTIEEVPQIEVEEVTTKKKRGVI